tara:strand:- start:837 stop:1514 length:678 start_codon:yes stop_codon:yes gene_type:complete
MKKSAILLFIFCIYCNYSYSQRITIKYIESRLVTHQGVEFIGELKDSKSADLYMLPNWDNEGVMFLNNKKYLLSNINFNISTNCFDSRIDREKLFSYKSSTIDSVEINDHLFKRVDDVFYEVLFENENNYFLKRHHFKVHKGAINRLNLSVGKSYTTLDYNYLIKLANVFEKVELNKKGIINLLKDSEDQELLIQFVKTQDLSYKKEKDFIEIFKYILKNKNIIQ